MIIEFELQGSKMLHKGLFDTTGLWVKYEEEGEFIEDLWVLYGYKIYSHISFAYYHTDKTFVDLVYSKLISVLRGAQNADIEGIGYIRKLNK